MKEICPECGNKAVDCICGEPVLGPDDDIPPTLRHKVKEVETIDEETIDDEKPSFSSQSLTEITPQTLLGIQSADLTKSDLIHPA